MNSSRDMKLLRLPEVLDLIPISKTQWWSGIKEGRFPKQIKIGPRTSAWKESDILKLIEKLSGESL